MLSTDFSNIFKFPLLVYLVYNSQYNDTYFINWFSSFVCPLIHNSGTVFSPTWKQIFHAQILVHGFVILIL
jgi:hypothetical protein